MKYLPYLLLSLLLVVVLGGCGKSSDSPEWKSASLLASSARYQQSGIDGQGNVLVIWAESSGFYANRYQPGTGWGGPQKIGDNSLSWSDLHLSVSKNGNAVVAWLISKGGPAFLQAVRFSTANGWGQVEDLGYHGTPKDVAITDAGVAFIVGSGDTGIFVGRYRQDSGWFFDELPYATNSASVTGPKIGLDGSGTGFIVWSEQDQNGSRVMTSLCSDDVLGAPESIASSTGLIYSNAVVSQNRNVMVLWAQTDALSVSHTYAKFYAASHGWDPAVQLDNSLFSCLDQAVSVDPDGNYYAIWSQRTASELTNVISARYLPSSGWQSCELVGGADGTAVAPQIAAGTSGSAFAAWQQYNPTDLYYGEGKVYGNQRLEGIGWSVPQQLKTALGSADEPSLAVGPAGSAMVLWSQGIVSNSGSIPYAIYYSRFE